MYHKTGSTQYSQCGVYCVVSDVPVLISKLYMKSDCMLIIPVLQMLMNVLKANTIAVQVHTAMTQLEGFSVPVSMDTLEMDIVAVCCALLNSLLQV